MNHLDMSGILYIYIAETSKTHMSALRGDGEIIILQAKNSPAPTKANTLLATKNL